MLAAFRMANAKASDRLRWYFAEWRSRAQQITQAILNETNHALHVFGGAANKVRALNLKMGNDGLKDHMRWERNKEQALKRLMNNL